MKVFCVVGVVDAKRDRSRPVSTPRDPVQGGAKPIFNLHRQTQSHLRWHAVPLRRTAFDGFGVRAAAELAPKLETDWTCGKSQKDGFASVLIALSAGT
jgi:hypothetical protein